MAKISVTEKDLSWYTRQGSGPLVIYLPGTSTWGPIDRPVLCSSIFSFVETFGKAVSDGPGLSLSYNMAQSFIKAGAAVLFQRFVSSDSSPSEAVFSGKGLEISAKYPGTCINNYKVTLSTIEEKEDLLIRSTVFIKDPSGETVEKFTASFVDPSAEDYYLNEISSFIDFDKAEGFDSIKSDDETTVTLSGGTDSKMIGSISDEIVKENSPLSLIEDPYLYDFDVAISAGFTKTISGRKIDDVDLKIMNAVMNRGTSMFFVDGTPDMTLDEFYKYCEDGSFDTSYAAGFGPWGYAKLLNNGSTVLLPGSYAMLVAWAQSVSEGVPLWMAPAGVKRASLGGFYVRPQYEIGRATLDSWQNHDDDTDGSFRINPIMKVKNYGYVVYGNSTLLRSRGNTSMLQSISTRVTANLIKREAFNISLKLQFDQMVGELFAQFRTLLSTYLDQMKYQGALFDYLIEVNEEATISGLNEKTVPVVVKISPAPAAENFDITLEITKSGITFSDTGASDAAVVE